MDRMQTVFGLFDDRADAEAAVRDLETRSFPRDAISILARHFDDGVATTTDREVVVTDSHAAAGARTGAVLGGVGGMLLGATALLVPGVGPLLALGPILGYGLIGAGLGAATGGVIGLLVDMGMPREHAEYYAEGLRRGGTIVSVQVANEEQAEIARAVMSQHHVVDIDQRIDYYRKTGFAGYSATAVPYTAAEAAAERERVRMAAANRPVVMETQPVVAETRPVVTETTTVVRTPDPPVVAPVDYHEHFRHHYTSTLANSGLTYEHYAPAYEYGYRLGSPGLHQHTWNDWTVLEPEARRMWEVTNPGTWETYREAIRAGWERSPTRVGGARLI
jgi:hypothetical protein